MDLAKFLASTNGRIARIVVGVVVIALGLFGLQDAARIVVVIIGAIPLAAGAFDVCLIAPLFGLPFTGKEIRAK